MVIYLPQQSLDEAPLLDEFTPREIVAELDKYVIGQADAKRVGCRRAPQPGTPPEARARDGRRGDAEKHPHDRAYRCR